MTGKLRNDFSIPTPRVFIKSEIYFNKTLNQTLLNFGPKWTNKLCDGDNLLSTDCSPSGVDLYSFMAIYSLQVRIWLWSLRCTSNANRTKLPRKKQCFENSIILGFYYCIEGV